MLSMLKRHEVEILLKAGHRKTEVARLTGVSLCSVKRIAQEGPVMHVDDAAERAQRQVGRPSTVANFRKPILEILQNTPDRASLEILRRIREAGYEGGKTALYALVASLRPSRPNRWFVSKVCPGSSVSMILDKSKCSSSMAPASASIFSLRV
jgi:transposase